MSNPASSYTYVLSPHAYAVPLLHAAKNLSQAVLGVFLGRQNPSTPNSIVVEIAIPLTHTYTSLSPMLEAALDVIERYAAESGLRIVGCYEIREEAEGFSRTGERLLRALRQNHDETFGVTLDNDRLSAGRWPYTICIPPKSADSVLKSIPGNPIPSAFSIASELPAKTVAAIRVEKIHMTVCDFDDQLEDASIDWPLNNAASELVSRHLPKA